MAAETKTIPTKTRITTNGEIVINVSYAPSDEFFLNFFVALEDRIYSGVSFKAGDLGYEIEGINDQFEIDDKGNLIVLSSETVQYEIDEEGDLIVTV